MLSARLGAHCSVLKLDRIKRVDIQKHFREKGHSANKQQTLAQRVILGSMLVSAQSKA